VEVLIFNNPDLGVRVQAANYFKKPGSGKTFSIGSIVKLKGNAFSGDSLFSKNCSSCHRVKNKGMDIGPNLTEIENKFQREALLDAIVNPNASVMFGYEAWLITTKSGDSFFGFLVADGTQAVVIKDLSGAKHTIPTTTIASRQKQTNSLMPEPSSLGLTDQNLADIAEYLMVIK
jgi:putative heme-binding domain-containing protein